jgi:hypothetical protein
MINKITSAAIVALITAAITTPASACKARVIQLAPGYKWANVYREASTRSAVLTRLGNGDKFCEVGRSAQFMRVKKGQCCRIYSGAGVMG